MKVLVTGSAGHLGEALIRTLKNSNHEVIGVNVVPSDFTNEVGSIINQDHVRRCMASVEPVFQSFVDTNITGARSIFWKRLCWLGVSAFVFTCTTSALTPPAHAPAAWVTEDVTPVPKTFTA